MKSLIKVILMSMYRKKGRSLMLVISIIFSVGLSYTVLSLSDLTEDIIMAQYQREYGQTDIILHNKDYSQINENIDIEQNHVNYIIEGFNIYGYTFLEESLSVNMFGYSENEINQIYNLSYLEQSNDVFEGNMVQLSKKNSEMYNLGVGDTITISIGNVDYGLIVHSIVEEGSSFLDYTPNTLDLIVSKDFITDTIGFVNPNIILIDSTTELDFEELALSNKTLEATNLLGTSNLNTEIQKMVVPMGIMAMAVVLIGAYIIASTFKVIVIDRMFFLGTLRSVGATKRLTTSVLLIESVIYGLIGSIIGIFSGFGILYYMANGFFGSNLMNSLDISYVHIPYLLITILFGVLISLLSALVPVLRTNKYSIKDIIFQKIKNKTKFSIVGSVFGIIFITLAFLLMRNVGTNDYMLFSVTTIVLTLIGGVLVIPLLIKLITPVLNIVLYPLFKENTKVAILNIKNDKTLINNIILLAVGLGTIFMINSFSSDVGRAVNGLYDQGSFDIILMSETVNDEFVDTIDEIDGVTDVYETGSINNVTTTNGFTLPYLDGIDPNKYEEFGWDVFKGKLSDSEIDKFNSSNGLIVTSFTAKKYELQKGDTVGIIYDDVTYNTEIVGIYSSLIQNGTQSFINESLFNEIYGANTLKTVYINAEGDLNEVKKDIKESYTLGILPLITLQEMKEENQQNNASLFMLMRGISILAMLIGAVGIINNFFVSFISRRKLIATLRSIGLSKFETVKLFIIESAIVGLIGSVIGVLFGMVLYYFMGFVVEGLNISSEVQSINISEIIFVLVSGMVICLTTALLPSISMARRNIVSEIKYE